MSTIGTVLTVLLMILAVILAAIILMQSKRSAGLGAVSGSSDTYWSKNKGNSMEGALEKYTKIGGALFMILAFIVNLVG